MTSKAAKTSKFTLSPSLLSKILMLVLVLTIGITGAGYYFATKALSSVVVKTDHAKTDADISDANLENLKSLQAQLSSKQDVIERTAQIVAESKFYRYQDQIINDINTFAARAGVQVVGYDFSAAQSLQGAAGSIEGVRSVDATINLRSPLEYTSFLRFLKAIEQNLTKMQVTGVSLTPSGNPDLINNSSVGLIIYVKG